MRYEPLTDEEKQMALKVRGYLLYGGMAVAVMLLLLGVAWRPSAYAGLAVMGLLMLWQTLLNRNADI